MRTAIMAARITLSAPVNIADIRREYHRAALTEADVDPDPVRQFERWLSEAIRAEVPEPTDYAVSAVPRQVHATPSGLVA